MWKFDPTSVDIMFVQISTVAISSGEINFANASSDLFVDTGDRTNDTSSIDQGLRVIDGNI